MRFSDLVRLDQQPRVASPAVRTPVDTDTYTNRLDDDPRNNGFVSGLIDRRRGRRLNATRRGFLRGTLTAAAATTAAGTISLFGPARKVEAQSGIVGTYPRRILQFCPPYNSGDNCQPGCGSSPICTDCCTSDGYFRNDPSNGYTLYPGGCGDGDIADGWIWRFKGKCGNCAEIEYRCSDGYVVTDTGPAPFICRAVTDCVPLAEGEAPGEALRDAARASSWNPAGALELAVDLGGAVSLRGWASSGSGTPLNIRVRADGAIVHIGKAGLARPDISASRRGSSPNVGFSISFPIDNGVREFCVDALSGALAATIGCVKLDVGSGASVRGSSSGGSLAAAPGGPPVPTATPAPTPTPIPLVGEIVIPDPGPTSQSPTYGAVQVIRRRSETTGFASGWAGDPDAADPALIEVLVDGESVGGVHTHLPRPDVTRAFEGLNDQTGFAVTFDLPSEAAEVCVVAISPDDGQRQPLGCQTLGPTFEAAADNVNRRPSASGRDARGGPVVYGEADSVTVGATSVVVTGWCFDPFDRKRPVTIEARTAEVSAEAETGIANPKIEEVYAAGPKSGFEVELELPTGTHELTISGLTSNGQAVEIGTHTVEIE